MTPLQIVLLVVGIFALQALIWIPIIVWFKRKSARIRAELADELARSGERVDRGPESALYGGATAVYPTVGGNGVIVLTERRLVFRRLVGAAVEVPVAEIEGLRADKWFRSAYRGSSPWLIVRTRGGAEVGFKVADHAAWAAAVTAATNRTAGHAAS